MIREVFFVARSIEDLYPDWDLRGFFFYFRKDHGIFSSFENLASDVITNYLFFLETREIKIRLQLFRYQRKFRIISEMIRRKIIVLRDRTPLRDTRTSHLFDYRYNLRLIFPFKFLRKEEEDDERIER